MTEAQPIRWWSQLTAPWRTDKLRQETLNYWHDQRPRPLDAERDPQEWYIAQLLPQELYHATQNHGLSVDLHCDTLALLVGYSIEPLFQVVGVYEPTDIILLLHKQYGEETGEDRGKQIKTWLTNLLRPHLTRHPEEIQIKVISEDEASAGKPGAVFRALCEHVLPHQRPGKRVVVDITGGKKSMDAGAFLFAAYAGIPVSYVDFDEYHPKERRPFGFTCRIGELENPYAAFRLRDWERVRRLYTDYHFRAAGETLREVLQVMHAPAFSQQHSEAAGRLLKILEFYETWDDGDYCAANQKLPSIRAWASDFTSPSAVSLLGPYWPDLQHKDVLGTYKELVKEQPSKPYASPQKPAQPAFFEKNSLLLMYAADELAKIKRLKDNNEDPRSTLLRAAGLNEVLLKARWVRLWQTQKIHFYPPIRSSDFSHQKDLYNAIINYESSYFMRRALAGIGYLGLETADDARYEARPQRGTPMLVADQPVSGSSYRLRGEQLGHLRNLAVHLYLSIPQSVAEDAYMFVKEDFEDFVAHWATLDGQAIPPVNCVTRMEWDDVCRLCGLDFLPLWQKEQP